ncbi:TPA: phage tail protein [Escherichia coli]|nr:phage tail protein [Escherichia coli]HCI7214408.1 phage tail protein [Escherichia coli]
MAKNDFKPFATAANANVTAQADWESLPALLSGFTAGKASSAQVNKAIRQASFIAAALAQYTANKSRLDVLDDGDLNGFISKMGTAFGKDFQALDATLKALAGLATGANKLPYFTGTDTAAQTDLTSVGRDIIGKNTIADILTYLGIKSAALRDVGAGTNQIPDMGSFGILKKAIGYQYLPGGLILQWGKVGPTNAGQTTNVTFTITNPTATVAVMCTLDATALPEKGFGCSAIGVARTGFGFHVTQDSAFNSNSGGFWFALGY